MCIFIIYMQEKPAGKGIFLIAFPVVGFGGLLNGEEDSKKADIFIECADGSGNPGYFFNN